MKRLRGEVSGVTAAINEATAVQIPSHLQGLHFETHYYCEIERLTSEILEWRTNRLSKPACLNTTVKTLQDGLGLLWQT